VWHDSGLGRPRWLCRSAGAVTLGFLLARLAVEFPKWASECLDGDRLRPGYIVNVDGDRFVRDLAEPLQDEASLLIMSADAGG